VRSLKLNILSHIGIETSLSDILCSNMLHVQLKSLLLLLMSAPLRSYSTVFCKQQQFIKVVVNMARKLIKSQSIILNVII